MQNYIHFSYKSEISEFDKEEQIYFLDKKILLCLRYKNHGCRGFTYPTHFNRMLMTISTSITILEVV